MSSNNSYLFSLPEGIENPYLTLGITRESSAKDIRKAYRRKAKEIHPDKAKDDPNAEKKFHLLQNAFEFLENENNRKLFNEFLLKKEEKKLLYEKQSVEKRRFAEKLEKAEREAFKVKVQNLYKRNKVEIINETTKGESLEQKQKKSREENEEWIKHYQQNYPTVESSCNNNSSPFSSPSNAASSNVDFPFYREDSNLFSFSPSSSSSSSSSSSKSHKTYVEVIWIESLKSPLNLTRAFLNLHFSSFNNPIIYSFDIDRGKSILEFCTRESALEAVLYFMKNKEKLPFKVRLLKQQQHLEQQQEQQEKQRQREKAVPPLQQSAQSASPGISFLAGSAAVPARQTTLADLESNVLNRLKEAVRTGVGIC